MKDKVSLSKASIKQVYLSAESMGHLCEELELCCFSCNLQIKQQCLESQVLELDGDWVVHFFSRRKVCGPF